MISTKLQNLLTEGKIGDLLKPMSKEEHDKLNAERDKIFEQIYNIAIKLHHDWWMASVDKSPTITQCMWLGDVILRYSNNGAINELKKKLTNNADKINFYYFIADKLGINVK
jgi:hypothetical protein